MPTWSKLYVHIEGEPAESIPMGIAETHHPATDDARATTASSSSGGKSVDWEKSQPSRSWVANPMAGLDKGKHAAAQGLSLPRVSRPPVSAVNLDNSPVTVRDLKVLIETINQKWGGLVT